jgi:hypothetical protein
MGEEIQFSCPYCGEVNYTEIFFSEGAEQTFITDCEVCCRPIELYVAKDREGNAIVEVKNDEGF